MADKQDPFFQSIGNAAEQTDLLLDRLDDDEQNPSLDTDEDRPLQEIESLCMSCGEQGMTRMLLTSIPYFREVIVMSFRCEHCGNTNNEIQSAGKIRERGTLYTAKIVSRKDLDRQVVKSATCTVTIPEFELTIPAHRGQLTNVEGILRDTVQDLSADQPLRRIQDEPTWTKIEQLISRLNDVILDEDNQEQDSKKVDPDDPITPFTVMLDDPAGNSFIEFLGSMADPKWSLREYVRTPEQNAALGLAIAENEEDQTSTVNPSAAASADDDDLPAEEIYVFPGVCPSCAHPVDTRMKKVSIPYFKDILIMSTNCSACGYRDNEVKSGGAISPEGRRIVLKVEDAEDLSRDILKSETCGLEIPEIELGLHAGTLGGRFTTLEGILTQVYDELSEKVFRGDSAGTALVGRGDSAQFEQFLSNLKDVMSAARPFTLILDDPLANSYLQNLYAPDPDPNMEITTYERTWEQDEELGLNDIKVEGYEAQESLDVHGPTEHHVVKGR